MHPLNLYSALTAIFFHISLVSATLDENSIDSCKGYSTSNVVETARGLKADLNLIGKGCELYGPDVSELRLVVEYENGQTTSCGQCYTNALLKGHQIHASMS